MSNVRDFRKSNFFPHKPVLTEKNLPDQSGKVFIVTGGAGGLGTELISILFKHNAKVYVTARSDTKATETINEVKKQYPRSHGELLALKLELDDLSTIKASAQRFLAMESRLDVLWNNAGVMIPAKGSKTKQGYELQLGVNNLGHFLFVHFLTPLLIKTASTAPRNSVRVIWVSSSAADFAAHPPIDFSQMNGIESEGIWPSYYRSKAGNVIQAAEYARRQAGSGILSLSLNPGNFVTNLQHSNPAMQLALFRLIAHEPRKGAYTELFAGLSTYITEKDSGGFVAPFGKVEAPRKDLVAPELGKEYWDWCEAQVKTYL